MSATTAAAHNVWSTRSAGPTDPESTFVDVGGGRRIAIVSEGRGPAVFLTHGLPGSQRDFRYLAPELAARGMRAIRIDWPGFGETPFAAFPATRTPDRAALFEKLANALDIDTFSIAGHSFGCAVCYAGAAQYADRVRLLVAINGIGVVRHKKFPRTLPALAFRGLAEVMARGGDNGMLHRRAVSMYKAFGFPHNYGAETYALHLRLISEIDFAEHRAALRKVRCPVMVFAAEDDPIVDERSPRLTAQAVNKAVRVSHWRFSSGGHYLQKHAAAEIAQRMHDVLVDQ